MLTRSSKEVAALPQYEEGSAPIRPKYDVIKEEIEDAMGENSYLALSRASRGDPTGVYWFVDDPQGSAEAGTCGPA